LKVNVNQKMMSSEKNFLLRQEKQACELGLFQNLRVVKCGANVMVGLSHKEKSS